MIAELGLLVALGTVPPSLTVVGNGGEVRVPVRMDLTGAPVLSAPQLLGALRGSVSMSEGWAEVILAKQPFRFLLGTPFYVFSGKVQMLAGNVSVTRDTLYLPFQFAAEILPYYLSERYRYDRKSARLEDLAGRLPNWLRPGHIVTIDPGHGGVDPGNPGTYFPRGVKEKDVTLQIGVFLRDELRRRGVGVTMTRTTDTLIDLADRGGYCSAACDLFVSLHVNSLARRRGYTEVRGFETFFLAEARTEDAARVAKMENDAVRFETGQESVGVPGGLDFILKDLQLNEHLRESARAAELVQRGLGTVHSGGDRGVKQAGFMVLTTARRPAILVELGYSTNPGDGRLLTQRSSQKAMASAIADAIVEYLREYERKVGLAGAEGGR